MSANNPILSEVIDIENKELNGSIDEALYLKKIGLLCILADKEAQRVWGEYSLVQQITSQPVLMNKAMSIPLTKEQVANLIEDLTLKYKNDLKVNQIEKVNLVFSTNIRGHAKSISKEIVLPRLGDWRFGYTNVYSAELVFHEFSHLLDYGRNKVQKYGKTDIHKHDFVRILDKMLVNYAKFIESKYVPVRQREQILNNTNLLLEFRLNQVEIEENDRQEELNKIEQDKIEIEKLTSEAGISEDNFPIYLLLKEDAENKINFLLFAISNYENKTAISIDLKNNLASLRDTLSSENSTLNKVQMNLLIEAINSAKLNDYLLTLPLMKQLKSTSILRTFIDEVRDLSRGKLASLKPQESFKIRTYSDADTLRKRGMED
jgi:hypothetical protein